MFLNLVLFLTCLIPFAQPASSSVVNASDGVPIHYEVQGKGEPTLVFIHCWSCNRHLWDNQVAEFSKTHRIVTIDLPGHGESGMDRKHWSVESFGDDVKTVVAKLDLKRVVLIGSSMGGPIALEAARRMPDRVVGIVPVDTLQNVEDKLPPDQLEGVFKAMEADFKGANATLMSQFFFSPTTPAAVKERILADIDSRPPATAIAILRGVFAYDAAPALREIKVPIRAINSDRVPTN
ncbi:MAG TPA: alpha/beta hydrolase, partial [Pyrinomonadaceae bacterium]|nr:alpha/beta hydrolase [Pyrinomonadaceae bacterium]